MKKIRKISLLIFDCFIWHICTGTSTNGHLTITATSLEVIFLISQKAVIGLDKSGVSGKYFSYFSMKTYVVGAH